MPLPIRLADATVRLLLIDAPERDQPPFGARARAALARLLAYAFLGDGRMINAEMVRSGFAVVLVYPPNVRYIDRIRAGAAEARSARRGLCAADGFSCTPKEHRRHHC